jgi:methionine-S-sulfoxide reductase
MPSHAQPTATATAIFAGGCFWCMQPPLDASEGVISTQVGYTSGEVKNPTYDAISGGKTGHVEAIKVEFDPKTISYTQLLTIFFENIDPFDANGQFADRGSQYKTAIFYTTPTQQTQAAAFITALNKKFAPKTVATSILPAETFYAAEEHHQDYYKKNPVHYTRYKYGSGRADGVKEIWGK